jgi:hypothetical protein
MVRKERWGYLQKTVIQYIQEYIVFKYETIKGETLRKVLEWY